MAPNARPLRVVLADPQSLFMEALRTALAPEQDIVVLGDATDGPWTVEQAIRLRADVVVLGADLPPWGAPKTTRVIKERLRACRVLVLAGDESYPLLIASLEAGASGLMTNATTLAELAGAVRSVAVGEMVVPKHMLGGLVSRLLERRRETEEVANRWARLSAREKQVLALLTRSGDNAVIAEALTISPETVRTHIQKILTKLGVHSRVEAVAFVLQNELFDGVAETLQGGVLEGAS